MVTLLKVLHKQISFFKMLSLYGGVHCVGKLDSGWVLENQKANSFLSVALKETIRGQKVCVRYICLHFVY